MPWLYLIIAGLFEVAWAIGLTYTPPENWNGRHSRQWSRFAVIRYNVTLWTTSSHVSIERR